MFGVVPCDGECDSRRDESGLSPKTECLGETNINLLLRFIACDLLLVLL